MGFYPEKGLGVLSASAISLGPTTLPQTSQNSGPPLTLVSCDLHTLWKSSVDSLRVPVTASPPSYLSTAQARARTALPP